MPERRSPVDLIAAAAVGFAAGCFLTAALRNPNQALTLAFPLGFGALWVLWMVYFAKKKRS
jgi:hypothetical protein